MALDRIRAALDALDAAVGTGRVRCDVHDAPDDLVDAVAASGSVYVETDEHGLEYRVAQVRGDDWRLPGLTVYSEHRRPADPRAGLLRKARQSLREAGAPSDTVAEVDRLIALVSEASP